MSSVQRAARSTIEGSCAAMLDLRNLITRSSETMPYRSGPWRTVPYPRRQYEKLTKYVPSGGLSESCRERAMREILTDKGAACESLPPASRAQCSASVPYDIFEGRFDTAQPCKADRVGCSKSDVGTNDALCLGVDVDACDTWGVDSFTRNNIQHALSVGGVL